MPLTFARFHLGCFVDSLLKKKTITMIMKFNIWCVKKKKKKKKKTIANDDNEIQYMVW